MITFAMENAAVGVSENSVNGNWVKAKKGTFCWDLFLTK